jgi:hypothetical protein
MTIMWEVRAASGQTDALLAWVLERADPAACVYRSADGRLVMIDESDTGLPDAPSELVARAPHSWRFTPVQR